MIRENHTAVVARNERWSGVSATEPYEAGWATEAVIFMRALSIERGPDAVTEVLPPTARVQISADGMRWIDEGTTFPLPQSTELDTCARVTHFGNWLRVVAELPADAAIKVLVTVHLK
jgi:hypothetical protein